MSKRGEKMNINEVEKARKKALYPIIICSLLDLILLSINIIYPHLVFFVVPLGITIITMIIVPERINNFRKNYFIYLMLVDIKNTECLKKIEYQPSTGFPYHKVYNSYAMTDGDKYKSSNYVLCSSDNIKLEQAHITISNINNTYLGPKTYDICFKGEWLRFTLPRAFKTNLYIYQKNFRNMIKLSVVGKFYKQVTSNFIEFDNKFIIRTNNEKEYLKMLQLVMLEVLEIRKKIKGKMMICFRDNYIYLGIDRYDGIVENPSIFHKYTEQDKELKPTGIVSKVFEIVDNLKIDSNLFKDIEEKKEL